MTTALQKREEHWQAVFLFVWWMLGPASVPSGVLIMDEYHAWARRVQASQVRGVSPYAAQ